MKIKLRTQKRDIKIVNRTKDVKRRFRVKNIRTLQQGMMKITPEQKQENTTEANATEEIFCGGTQLAKKAVPHKRPSGKKSSGKYQSKHGQTSSTQPPIQRYSEARYGNTPAPHSVPGHSYIREVSTGHIRETPTKEKLSQQIRKRPSKEELAEQIHRRVSPQEIRTGSTTFNTKTVQKEFSAIKSRASQIRQAPKTKGTTSLIGRRTIKSTPRQATAKTGNATMKRRVVRAQQKQAAIAVAKQKKAVQAAKRVQAALKTSIQAVARAMSRLVAAILGGAGGVLVPLVIVLLLAALVCSPLGLFLNREADNELTLQQVMSQLNTEFSQRIQEIEDTVAHDDVQTTGQRAVWNEILTVYAVKTTTESSLDVASMDEEHAEILTQIFWDMNTITYTTEVYTEEETVEVPAEDSTDEDGVVEETRTVERNRLIISLPGKTAQQMAEEYGFSQQQRQYVTELLSEDYKEFWTLMSVPGGGSSDIVAVAESQLGNIGGQPYWSWYGFSYRVEWCACFVSWCADQCGYIDAGILPKFAGVYGGIAWFKDRGQWLDNSAIPEPGMIAFFDWAGDNDPDHVGIVESCDGTTVYTIEGNSSDACRRRSYPVGYYEIYGYGIYSVP